MVQLTNHEASRLDVTLTDEQIRQFRDDGFIALDAITTQEEVEFLREVFDRLFASKAGFAEGAQYDMMGKDDGDEPPRLPQIIRPENYAPELRNTAFRANALAIAKQLLGPAAGPAFSHAILKPAFHGAATPWHQDEVHRYDPNFDYEQLSIWMPLQEASIANGCMQYIPGSNRGGCLPHRSPNNDPTIHAIETDPTAFDASLAHPCPIPAGGCTIHHGRTLHYAGPNNSPIPRRAYILAFELPPMPRTEKRDFPWNREKRSANLERRRSWRRKGGLVVESWRRLRNEVVANPRRLIFEVRRAIGALFKR